MHATSVLLRNTDDWQQTAGGRRILHENSGDVGQGVGYTRAAVLKPSVDSVDAGALEKALHEVVKQVCDSVAGSIFSELMDSPVKISPGMVVPAKDDTEISIATVSHDDERYMQVGGGVSEPRAMKGGGGDAWCVWEAVCCGACARAAGVLARALCPLVRGCRL